MLGAVLSNPKLSDMAFTAVGMSTQDIRTLKERQIPIWSVVLASALVGGIVVARYMPDTWLKGLREIGK